MAKEYIEGKRRVFNPFQYVLLSVGVIIFLMLKLEFYDKMAGYNAQQAARLPSAFQQGMRDFNAWVKQYSNIITFLSIPVYALLSWLFFKRRGHNYAEHFTLVVFLMCMLNTINAAMLLLFLIFMISSLATAAITFFLMMFCFALTYRQFYQVNWGRALLYGIGVYVSSYIVQVMLMGMGLAIYIVSLMAK